MAYLESEYLQLSGLQHFAFCRRQWALIHIEQVWADNFLTADGTAMHNIVHDKFSIGHRDGKLLARSLYVFSPSLGISGQCDLVEFIKDNNGAALNGKPGLWRPFPVEYKHGKPKKNDADRLQLCAQAMCLEEMHCCDVNEGALFYGGIKKRENIVFSEDLRNLVRKYLLEMHDMFSRGHTPIVRKHKGCKNCSLEQECISEILCNTTVEGYISKAVFEDEETS